MQQNPSRKVDGVSVSHARLIDGKKLSIMLLDDHPVALLGVCTLLNAQQDMQVTEQFCRAEALMQCLEHRHCDLVVVDFHLAHGSLDGDVLLRRLRNAYPDLMIVVYSSDSTPQTEYAVWRARANAFLCKRAALVWLIEIIRAVRYRPLRFHGLREQAICEVIPTLKQASLSPSEIEVLRQLSHGLSVCQVASKLHRSKQTISSHKRSAMHKLQLGDDLSLALYLKDCFSY